MLNTNFSLPHVTAAAKFIPPVASPKVDVPDPSVGGEQYIASLPPQSNTPTAAVEVSLADRLKGFEGGYTQAHMERSSKLALDLADQLGLPAQEREDLRQAGNIYDLGKLTVPEEVWNVPGKPSPEQWNQMMEHVNLGGNPEVDKLFAQFAEAKAPGVGSIVRHHHERWDGNGYPDKLKGNEIPIGAQLLGMADMFDSLVTDRPWRKGKDVATACSILQDCAGKGQFNPELARLFADRVSPPAAPVADVGWLLAK